VIHAGALDVEDVRSEKLFDLYISGQKDSDAFRQERERILKLREEKKDPYSVALIQSLKEILPHSQSKNVTIGLETRYYPTEIPNFDEIGYLLDLFGEQGIGYWHDVGHAEINERLGITPHTQFLDAYKDRLIGVHLHGVKGKRDHLAPFEGDMDLNKFLPYFGSDILKVIESKPFASVDLMKEAVVKLSV